MLFFEDRADNFEAVDDNALHKTYRPPQLSVIVPTRNEAGNIHRLIDGLDDSLRGIVWEVIFVDDWSSDGTADIVAAIAQSRPGVRLIRRFGRRGLSSAVIEGMLSATAPVVAVIDGDLQHDEAILPLMFGAISDGHCDIAIGTRYADGGSTGQWSSSRVWISGIATWFSRKLTRVAVSDPMSGIFALPQSRIVRLAPGLSNIGFKLLLDILLTSPEPLRTKEVPYRFRTRIAGISKLDTAVAVDFILLLLDKLVGRWLPPRFILFAAVGGTGLIVHLGVLRALLAFELPFGTSQATAVAVAIGYNFLVNNQLTFRDRRLRGVAMLKGLFSFYLMCGLGAIANVGVGTFIYAAHEPWWLAGIAGAVSGALWNYATSSALTWRKH